MFSTSFSRITGILLFCLAAATSASAQYGGGMGGTGGTGSTGSSGYGSGNGKAIGIGVGVAAGAAVGIALLVHHHHAKAKSQASLVGCTQSMMNGITLKNEKDDLTYTIISSGTALQPGQRVELAGVASDEKSGIRAFSVHKIVNNFGACGSAAADKAVAANSTLLRAAN
jgi:hypothetical protein